MIHSKKPKPHGLRGRRLPEDTKKKISEAMTGRKYTEEHRAKIAAGNREPKPWLSEYWTGVAKSEEHKNNIRKAILERQEKLRNYEIENRNEERPFFGFSNDDYDREDWSTILSNREDWSW
jgi:NUMOD3 motif